MKNTLYFSAIEEARQYFPDGVPSNVIAIVGDGSQVLVSSDNAVNANQQYYNADLTNDDIVNEMVQDSYDEGEAAGYETGHAAGYTEGETAGYETGYAAGYAEGEASAVPSYTDQQKFAISSSDMLSKGSLNNINYGVMTPSYGFDTSIWSSLTQMAQGNYAVLYKWSESTMTTLPFYSNYDEEVGATPVSINVGTQDELEIQDSLIYATATLAAGDKICVGFYISDNYNHTGQFSGISSASSLYTIQTAGDYIIVVYTGGYDDETGDPLPPTTVISSNPYNASGTILPMQPAQS